MYNEGDILHKKGNIYNNMKIFFLIINFLFISISLWGGAFEKGKDSFLNNNPKEAALFFEQAVIEEPLNENVYMYLGLTYIQNGQIEKAISVFLKGADLKGVQKGRFYLNTGNAYYSINRIEDALYMYESIINENLPEKGDALLNRANIYMGKEELAVAVGLYREYLTEVPQSEQKEKIQQLIRLVEDKLNQEALEAERIAAEAERLRLEEEKRIADAAAEEERIKQEEERIRAEAAVEAEKRRLADEKRKAEEAARQQALMDEILNSLSTIKDDTQNIAADSETIKTTDEESDIDD